MIKWRTFDYSEPPAAGDYLVWNGAPLVAAWNGHGWIAGGVYLLDVTHYARVDPPEGK